MEVDRDELMQPAIEAIEGLVFEHREFARLARGMERFKVCTGTAEDVRRLGQFVRLFRLLVERWHFEKEEALVWPALGWRKEPSRQKLLAVMNAEHEEMCGLSKTLRSLSTREQSWTDEERRLVSLVVARLIDLLTSHMQREERFVFPLVTSTLAKEERQELILQFKRWSNDRPSREPEMIPGMIDGLLEQTILLANT